MRKRSNAHPEAQAWHLWCTVSLHRQPVRDVVLAHQRDWLLRPGGCATNEHRQLIERQRESFAGLTREDQHTIAQRFVADAPASTTRKIHLATESVVVTFTRDEVAAALKWAPGATRAGASASQHRTCWSHLGLRLRELNVDGNYRSPASEECTSAQCTGHDGVRDVP
jgi:hypothetical protein